MLTIANLERTKAAHSRFIQQKDGARACESWTETLKSSQSTKLRLEKEKIASNDVESLFGIVEEAKTNPSKQHINGLTTLMCFSADLKEEIMDVIDDWVEDVGMGGLTSQQALANIDAYQISPVRRVVSFLYVAQLDESAVFEAIHHTKRQESVERLMKIHHESFFKEDRNPENRKVAEQKISTIIHREMHGITV